MIKCIVAGGVIVNPLEEILLVYMPRTQTWGFPKGHVIMNKDIYLAALREIKEETSIENLKLVTKLPVYERETKQDSTRIKQCHFYLFTTTQLEVYSNDPFVSKVEWTKKDDVPTTLSYKEDVEFYNKIKHLL